MAIVRITQQSYKGAPGSDPVLIARQCLQLCIPACFFMLGKNAGYLASIDFDTFAADLDWGAFTDAGWIRATFARQMRERYGIESVSWRPGKNIAPTQDDLVHMQSRGYFSTPREREFFRDTVVGKTPLQLAAESYPLLVGVKPKFATNEDAHGIILERIENGTVLVVDPDERNTQSAYALEYIEQYINPIGGGCTIVLQKE